MKSTLTNEQLIAKAKQWIKDLCESGGHKWCLRVPADHNHDPDLIFSELCNRLEEYAHQSGPRWVRASERLPEFYKKLVIRVDGEKYICDAFYHSFGRFEFPGNGFRNEDNPRIEWLDESSPVVSYGEGMAEALRKFNNKLALFQDRLPSELKIDWNNLYEKLTSLSPAP